MPIASFGKPIKLGGTTFYSTGELSKVSGITPQTIRKYLKSGKLKGKKVGGSWFVTESSLKKFFGNDKEENKKDEK